VRASEEQAFRDYADARMPSLRRTALLLTGGDWHRAEDIVSAAALKLYVSWRRASRAQHLDAYVRQILVRTWLDEQRRPWRREHAVALVPDVDDAPADDLDRRADLREVLARLPSRQRAVLVLRFYEDLSVDQTADALGCTAGAVKTLTNRAISAVRRRLPDTLFELENAHEQRSAHHARPAG
jgi:RNA polymerase sigma-70 factor (sigma-E family)